MFDLINPAWMILLPLPYVIYRFFPAVKTKSLTALKLPFFQSIKNLLHNHKLSRHMSWFSVCLISLIWILILIALAQPVWYGDPVEIPQSGRNIMLAIDLSGSMRIPDMELNGKQVNRLAVVKEAAKAFIDKRQGDRLGLILFGTKAYLQTPLTFDRKTVTAMLEDATIGLAGSQTAIGDAIGLGIKQLANQPGKAKVLILLTDGGNNAGQVTPINAAEMAAKHGIKIYTIGIGAHQIIVQGLFGPEVVQTTSQLDEAALKQIADITGGMFFRAENTEDLTKVYEALDAMEPIESQSNTFRPQQELYMWPLGAALLLSFILAVLKLLSARLPIIFARKHYAADH